MTTADAAGWPRLPPVLVQRARRLRLLALDVDGVLTDGTLWFDEDGREIKRFHVRDGHGIKRARAAGIEVVFVSGRTSPQLAQRAGELGVEHVRGAVKAKDSELADLARSLGVAAHEIAAIGDDLPDLAMFSVAALSIAVADAVPEVRDAADWVTGRPGGSGAVREAIESILLARSSG